MMNKSDRFSSALSFSAPKSTSTKADFNESTRRKCIDDLIDAAYVKNDYSFCVNFPIAVRSFVASIIQSSLSRIYDNEIGVLSDEPKGQVDYSKNSLIQSGYDAYNLIDTSLEKMLTPSKQLDENAWISKAKLQETPCVSPNIDWPTNEAFTPELGAEKIKLYIKSWDLTCGWVYALKMLPSKEKRFWTEYYYEVRFSIPTRRQPIPKYTVSVFFTLRRARCKPRKTPIDVCYVVESLSQKNRPGEHVFNEEWLKMVLEYKAKLGERLCF
ncbi:A kinase anchor protein 14 [Echinococcus multilocularis]|uniref:A kinase anchor protein 14 n=1 Tax=Echinococcus multilocularis TaxID=6211 RepID=A0A087VZC7_ECHMU|nr:A kinase anchor protein 14 [Echinococcus multilocularis]